MRIGIILWAAFMQLGLLSVSASLSAQSLFEDLGLPTLPDGLGESFAIGPTDGEKVRFSASYELQRDGTSGRLMVVAEVVPGHHIYSTTQPDGGPMPTRIRLETQRVELAGPFISDHPPEIASSPYFPVPSEEFHGRVQWTAPLRIKEQFKPEETPLALQINGQVCLTDGNCQPFKKELSAEFTNFYEAPAAAHQLRVENTHAVWSATIEPAQVTPGDRATLRLTVVTDPGYHVYKYQPSSPEPVNRTLIVASRKGGLKIGTPRTEEKIITRDMGLDQPFEYYPGSVQWMIPIEVPAGAELGQRPIELLVGFNTCDDRSCDPPAAVRLSGILTVAESLGFEPGQMTLEPIKWLEVANHPELASWIDRTSSDWTWAERLGGRPLELWMIGAALLGGFILNFMPCVLPVIGLKLISFVNQSGSSHSRVVSLNLSFVGGILAVMLILAAINIAFKLAGQAFGWGEQFNRIEFQVGLTILLFAMSLSFLGVWEIPIPGFATGSKSGELMQREGLSGAFYKGILTTILATPCSGPFLGTLFGLTLTLSTLSILTLFGLVGIGLGLPYLALCFWPGFVKLLPKPGNWMETLKEVLAFPLLLTVVYFISVIDPDYRIATLTLLIAVWFGCWLIGRVPAYFEARRRVASWLVAGGVCILAGFISFNYFGPTRHHLPWQDFSESVLAENRAAGRVVMIDFTARWCLTCQYNLRSAIDRPAVAELVKQNNVIPLLADWSSPSEEIEKKLRELDSNSIPLLAIYPAGPDSEPIILRDVITQAQLIEALKQAGPSSSTPRLTAKSTID